MKTFSQIADEWIRANLEVQHAKPQAVKQISHDPFDWIGYLQLWLLERCAYHTRFFSGIGTLHVDFAEWATADDSVSCTRRTFELLLRDVGFLFVDGLVSGLVLKSQPKNPSSNVSKRVRNKRNKRPNTVTGRSAQ
jgi:hypothetical protein